MRGWRHAARSALLFRQQAGALPQSLIFFVTSRCNARCPFCLYYEQITNPVARERELRVDEVEQIARRYGPLYFLGLSGGEPFVRKDLAELCQPFISHCGTAVIDIPSNFFYRDTMLATVERLAAANPGVMIELQLSLDHIGEKHDASRRVPGLYKKAVESFHALAALRERWPNVKLKVSVVWLPANRDDLDLIAATVRDELPCDRLQLVFPHEVLPASGAANEETRRDVLRYVADAARLAAAIPPRTRADLHTLGLRAVKTVYERLLVDAVLGHHPVGEYCEAGRHIAVINETGEVFPCENLWVSIGNLRDAGYDMRTLLAGPAYAAFREKYLGPGKCNCTWSCAINSYISVTPRLLPELALNAARLAAGH